MKLKNVLRRIHPNSANLVHGRSPLFEINTRPHSGTLDAAGGRPHQHDYKRHGTTTLFAALNVLEGKVIGRCMQRHRHEGFIRFRNAVDREVPAAKTIEAIVDNYATHKHPKVQAWLKRHLRWTFHFTPTSASWLNAVENFFFALTRKRIRRASFHSIVDLQAAINRYLAERPLALARITTANSSSRQNQRDEVPIPIGGGGAATSRCVSPHRACRVGRRRADNSR
jgi:transposase